MVGKSGTIYYVGGGVIWGEGIIPMQTRPLTFCQNLIFDHKVIHIIPA
jgi:hypothetical protein